MALGWVWWRAWSPLVAQCRGVALGTGLGLVARLVAANAEGTLRGRRGTHLRFAWQAWQLWHWAGSGGVLGRR